MKNAVTGLMSVLLVAAFILIAVASVSRGGERFPHEIHIEAEVDCLACHVVEESEELSPDLIPSVETCEACHDEAELSGWEPTRTAGEWWPV